MTFLQKIAMMKAATPALLSVSADSSVFHVRFSSLVSDVVVTGQGGLVRWKSDSTTEILLPIEQTDTYLRTSYTTQDGIRYHLNPVCRYNGVIGNRKKLERL